MFKNDLEKVRNYVERSYNQIQDSKTQYQKDKYALRKFINKMYDAIEFEHALKELQEMRVRSLVYYSGWQSDWDISEIEDLLK